MPSKLKSQIDEPRLSFPQAAERLGVSVDSFERWVKAPVCGEQLKEFRIGARRFILESDLHDFVNRLNCGTKSRHVAKSIIPGKQDTGN